MAGIVEAQKSIAALAAKFFYGQCFGSVHVGTVTGEKHDTGLVAGQVSISEAAPVFEIQEMSVGCTAHHLTSVEPSERMDHNISTESRQSITSAPLHLALKYALESAPMMVDREKDRGHGFGARVYMARSTRALPDLF